LLQDLFLISIRKFSRYFKAIWNNFGGHFLKNFFKAAHGGARLPLHNLDTKNASKVQKTHFFTQNNYFSKMFLTEQLAEVDRCVLGGLWVDSLGGHPVWFRWTSIG
jgi:hypothetical protein